MIRGGWRHLAWATLGAVSVPALWFAWSLPGAAVMFACIALSFVMWHRLGRRGSWLALVALGLGMSGLLAWQALTGSRCPQDGGRVFLRADRPPIACADVRASAATMSAFFGLVALIGLAAPAYARRLEDAPSAADHDVPA